MTAATVRPTVPLETAEEMRRLYATIRGARLGKVGPDMAGTRSEAARLGELLVEHHEAGGALEALALALDISVVTVRQRMERYVLDQRRAARAGAR